MFSEETVEKRNQNESHFHWCPILWLTKLKHTSKQVLLRQRQDMFCPTLVKQLTCVASITTNVSIWFWAGFSLDTHNKSDQW